MAMAIFRLTKRLCLVLLATGLGFGTGRTEGADAAAKAAPTEPLTAVEAAHGMVVSVSPVGSQSGLNVLKQGGNAVDAAVATAMAMAVAWPEAGNIGGGGFMMVYPGPGMAPACVEYRESAPAGATATMFAKERRGDGCRVCGVPGTVAGLALAHRRYGRLPWRDLVMPAVRLARDGFAIDRALASSLNGALKRSPQFAELLRVFKPPRGKSFWEAGDRLVQLELAGTLELIAARGSDGFYRGVTADRIVAEMKAGNGLISKEDLAGYRANLRAPIHGTYRGYDIYAPAPPSSGGICLVEMLNILENFPAAQLRAADDPHRWSAQGMHWMIEAMRRAYRDRARWLGDSDFTPIPSRLTTKEYARALASQIDPRRATRSEDLAEGIALAEESPQTTHFSVSDGRMAVANTYTLENSFGAKVVVRGGGFLLNNEMTDFNPVPGRTTRSGMIGTSANLIAPGKRMLSSQTPTLVCRNDRLVLVTGSPGGRTIINTVFCTLVRFIDFGDHVQQAVDAPRLHHAWFPDIARFEAIDVVEYRRTIEQLKAMGHIFDPKPQRQGDAHSISIDAATGRQQGATDRRINGCAAGGSPSGLVAHWKFDEGQGDVLADSSGHNYAGDLIGAGWATGASGTAAHFGGIDSYVTIPQLGGLDGSNELTVEAWVLWEAGGRYPNVLTGGQWSPGGFMIFVSDRSCSFRMGRPGARPGVPAGPWQEASAPLLRTFQTGQWYHLAATFQRPTITTYVNGRKVGAARWDYPVAYEGPLEIGRWGGPLCHRGLIGEVMVFNRALRAEEIQAGYAAQSPRRMGPGPAAYTVVPAAAQPVATLENHLGKLEIDRRGRCIALLENRSGKKLLAASEPLATIKLGGKAIRPTACSWTDGRLRLDFGPCGARATLACASRDRYFTFTVLSVEGAAVESLTFFSVAVQPGKQSSGGR
jgi:gamma-glutamyltranspeptidase/glutathione hydrolase